MGCRKVRKNLDGTGAAGRGGLGPRPGYAPDRPSSLDIPHIPRLGAVIPDPAGPGRVGPHGTGRRRRGRAGGHVVVGGARRAEDAALR